MLSTRAGGILFKFKVKGTRRGDTVASITSIRSRPLRTRRSCRSRSSRGICSQPRAGESELKTKTRWCMRGSEQHIPPQPSLPNLAHGADLAVAVEGQGVRVVAGHGLVGDRREAFAIVGVRAREDSLHERQQTKPQRPRLRPRPSSCHRRLWGRTNLHHPRPHRPPQTYPAPLAWSREREQWRSSSTTHREEGSFGISVVAFARDIVAAVRQCN